MPKRTVIRDDAIVTIIEWRVGRARIGYIHRAENYLGGHEAEYRALYVAGADNILPAEARELAAAICTATDELDAREPKVWHQEAKTDADTR